MVGRQAVATEDRNFSRTRDTHVPLRPALIHRSTPAFWIIGAVGAGALGFGTAYNPQYAAVALLALIVIYLAARWPMAVLLLGLTSLVWVPEDIFAPAFGSYPQAQKFLLLAAGVIFALVRGFRWRYLVPCAAYILMALMSKLGGIPAPGLTQYQGFLSWLTLNLAWILLSVKWTRADGLLILRWISWLAPTSVIVGALLTGAGQWQVIGASSPPRLEGALIPAFLAGLAVSGVAASLLLSRLEGGRWAQWLLIINAAILVMTFARGALIAGGFALLPLAVRSIRAGLRSATPMKTIRNVVLLLCLIAAASLVASGISTRDKQSIFVPGQGVVKGDASSGRFAAWSFAYKQAKVSILFGRGLGAAPVIGANYQHFLAQHNEYLRMLLEGGFVGGILVLAGIIFAVVQALRAVDKRVRIEMISFAVGIAIYSVTDNTLTSPQFSAPMLLCFASGVAYARPATVTKRAMRRSGAGRPAVTGFRASRAL